MDDITFREEQRYTQWWLWTIVGTAPAGVFGLFVTAMYRQFVLHVPFGDKPMPDSMLLWFGPLMMLLMLGLVVLFATTRLVTEVRGDGVYIRYYPFHRRFHWFLFSDIVEATAITYSPMRDFGGWGIRYGRTGKAYNVRGNRGVMLTFGTGAQLLIGAQRADECADAINAHLRRPGASA